MGDRRERKRERERTLLKKIKRKGRVRERGEWTADPEINFVLK
jgi:hypothetical protein